MSFPHPLRPLVLLLGTLLVAGLPLRARAQASNAVPPGTWQIVQNQTYATKQIVAGVSNRLYLNCTFQDGVQIKNTSNVYFKNCEITRSTPGVGIWLGDTDGNHDASDGTDRVTFDGCYIHDTTSDSLQAKRPDEDAAGESLYDHTNLKIINCKLYNWGTGYPGNKLFHSLYLKCTDFLVENNVFHNRVGGSTISCRNAGVVRGNKVFNDGPGMATITYWSQFRAAGTKRVLFENNVCYEKANDPNHNYPNGTASYRPDSYSANIWVAADDQKYPPSSEVNKIAENIIVRFNTVVVLAGINNTLYSPIRVNEVFSGGGSAKNVEVYGNLVVDLRDAATRASNPFLFDQGGSGIDKNTHNLVATTLAGFLNPAAPFDFRLTASHPAIGFANSASSRPSVDKDGVPRAWTSSLESAASLDAGAYEFVNDNGYLRLQNQLSGDLYLRPENGSSSDNVTVTQQSINASWYSAQWVLEPTTDGDGSYRIKNRNGSRYLQPKNASDSDNGPVAQRASATAANQKWYVEYEGNGLYRIKNKGNGRYLRLQNGSSAPNTPTVQQSWQDYDSYRWRLLPAE